MVSRALSEAVREQIIAFNPAQNVIYPSKGETEKRVLSPENVNMIEGLDINPRLRDMLILAAHAGLRRGELCGLRWEDVDFEANSLQVNQQLVRFDGRINEQAPKTRSAVRVVFLTDQARDAIARQPRRSHLVFTCEEGTPVRPDNFSRDYRALRSKIGLDGVRLHDFRASFITFLFEAGVDPRTVQELVGHSTSRVTQEVYARSRQETKVAAMAKLTSKLTSTPKAGE